MRQRTCIGCRAVKPKQEMLRLCRSASGEVSVDVKGNEPGRGAYVCSENCLKDALDRNLISRSLRVRFANEFEEADSEAIRAFFSDEM